MEFSETKENKKKKNTNSISTNSISENSVSAATISAENFMPETFGDQKILEQRANYFAKYQDKKEELNNTIHYVHFLLGKTEHYGIAYQFAKEVLHNSLVTKLPNMPEYIAGVMNRRSALIAVIDLKKIFHIQTSEEIPNHNIIIVNTNHMTVGILVDHIIGSDLYDPLILDAPIASEGISNSNYILGLHHSNISIINMTAILSDPELISFVS